MKEVRMERRHCTLLQKIVKRYQEPLASPAQPSYTYRVVD